MIPIIAISGRAGAGKDSLAAALKANHFPDAALMSFALPLKDLCISLFGLTAEQCWGPSECRETEIVMPHRTEFDAALRSEVAKIFPSGDTFSEGFKGLQNFWHIFADMGPTLTARHVLQQIGTEWGRSIDPEVWVKSTLRAATAALHAGKGPVFITDARFPNETWGVRGVGGVAVLVQRPGLPELPRDVHVSEKWAVEAPGLAWDIVATNDGTIADLARSVSGAMFNCGVDGVSRVSSMPNSWCRSS